MGKQRSTRRVIAVLAVVAAAGAVAPGPAYAAPSQCIYNGGATTAPTEGPDVIACGGISRGQRLETLGGNDSVTVGGDVGGVVDLGVDDDFLDIRGSTTALIRLGSGNDAVTIAGNMGDGGITGDAGFGGEGTDIVIVTGDVGGFGFRASISVEGGDDSVTIGRTLSTESSVDTGVGNDTVEVALNVGIVRGGFGNDTLEVTTNDGLVRGDGGNDFLAAGRNLDTVDGGAGFDTCVVVDGRLPKNCEAP